MNHPDPSVSQAAEARASDAMLLKCLEAKTLPLEALAARIDVAVAESYVPYDTFSMWADLLSALQSSESSDAAIAAALNSNFFGLHCLCMAQNLAESLSALFPNALSATVVPVWEDHKVHVSHAAVMVSVPYESSVIIADPGALWERCLIVSEVFPIKTSTFGPWFYRSHITKLDEMLAKDLKCIADAAQNSLEAKHSAPLANWKNQIPRVSLYSPAAASDFIITKSNGRDKSYRWRFSRTPISDQQRRELALSLFLRPLAVFSCRKSAIAFTCKLHGTVLSLIQYSNAATPRCISAPEIQALPQWNPYWLVVLNANTKLLDRIRELAAQLLNLNSAN